MTITDERAPTRDSLPPGRQAGVCLHITSLPGGYGIGELGEQARRFIDFIAQAGIKVWQFLPTGPTAYGDSPYQPLSSFAGNEMLIDIGALLELDLLMQEEVVPLTALPLDHVDFGHLIPIKNALLKRAASRFADKAPDYLKRDHQAFLLQHDDAWLHDYALFRSLKAFHEQQPWSKWKKQFRAREEAALREYATTHKAELEAIKIIQFLFYEQWRELQQHAEKRGVWLFGDMPIYIALDSADAWSAREMLQVDEHGKPQAVAGVPPDYFSEDGQLWGNPLYDWDYHDKHGYDWWIQRIRHATAMASLVRIDHFRGFESYWSVPAGDENARNGHWVPGPGDRLFDAMQGALGRLPIVAEDLGVITPEVEALRDRHHLPGMVVLQFEIGNPEFKLENMRENCVCYTGTHDNDTTLGWFMGSKDDTRSADEKQKAAAQVLKVTHGTAETVHDDMVRIAMASNARLAIAPMQDYLGLDSSARFNTPGKPGNNWQWRLGDSALTKDFAERLGAVTRAGNRGI
ncbi:MAG: 4-alpha-glucanotransferase [Woeseia sp.]